MSRYDTTAPYGARLLALAGLSDALDADRLSDAVRARLDEGVHGLCFSPYLDGQAPGSLVSEAQIRDRLRIVAPHTRWVRTFSCTEGHEATPRLAKEAGLKTLVGAWLGDDEEKNEQELRACIAVAKAGHADIVAVGNEVLLRGDLPEDALIDALARVQAEVGDVPVGYVDAYFEFVDHPAVTAQCDVVLANCYPFWEGCAAEYSLLYMKDMYRRAQRAAAGKKVIITETGWPDTGSATGAAVPSRESAMRYFLSTYEWADTEDIEIFYFSAFDEAWKVGDEGDVGAYWGLWDKDGRPKYA